MKPRELRLLSLGAGLLVAAALFASPGCEMVGAPFAAFDSEEGPQPVAAQYTGLVGRRVAVLVQMNEQAEFRFPESTAGIANVMTSSIAQNVEGVTVLAARRTLAYQQQNPFWPATPPSRLLRALEVDRLIVVDVEEYRTQEPGNRYLWRGVIDAIVSVYEAESPDPDDKSFEQRVRAEWPEGTTVGLTEGDDATLQTAALAKFTLRGAGLFFDHEE
ncbi:MAG: hypothetical protein AAGE65_07670 [Planctomycetota bacterium]